MKVRDLIVVSAFVLGVVATARCGDVLRALREYEFTSPLYVAAETAWADACGASRTKLEAELATQRQRLVAAEQEKSKLRESLELQIEELGRADAHVGRLVSDLEHSERVRETQAGELEHCRQLIDAQEAVVRETNWRYQMLARRLRELGQEGVVSVLVKE